MEKDKNQGINVLNQKLKCFCPEATTTSFICMTVICYNIFKNSLIIHKENTNEINVKRHGWTLRPIF